MRAACFSSSLAKRIAPFFNLFLRSAHLFESNALCLTLQYCEVVQRWKEGPKGDKVG